jgi:hypothetical protein
MSEFSRDTAETAKRPAASPVLPSLAVVLAITMVVAYGWNVREAERREAEMSRSRQDEARAKNSAHEQEERRLEKLFTLMRSSDGPAVASWLKHNPADAKPLFLYSCWFGHVHGVEWAAKSGFDARRENWTYAATGYGQVTEPLLEYTFHNSVGFGYTDIAQLLLSQRAGVSTREITGWTPLAIASYHGHLDCVRLLLVAKAGVDAEVIPKASYRSPLRSGPSTTPPVEEFPGMTPLILAAKGGHDDVVRLLLIHGADVHHRSRAGLTALKACRVDVSHREDPPSMGISSRAMRIREKVRAKVNRKAVEESLLAAGAVD